MPIKCKSEFQKLVDQAMNLSPVFLNASEVAGEAALLGHPVCFSEPLDKDRAIQILHRTTPVLPKPVNGK
ncbi:MAG TPA: hypothetical protein VHP31_08685 [Caproicibacter sp.]|nr:hypothetical protein [Caproicibacter sp.]